MSADQFHRRRWLLLVAGLAASCLGADDADVPTGEITDALSQTYTVGPTRTYKTLADVAGRLAPGDIVLVDGNATYPAVRFTQSGTATSPITIRGVRVSGKRPVISGGTNTVHFMDAHNIIFEGFEVTGGTSRCVFHQGNNITIQDSAIHDCPAHGVLGADNGSGTLTLRYTELYRCGLGDQKHCVYAATDQLAFPGAKFRMEHCYLHDGNGGNMVKSRAERNEIYYNWIQGARYHQLELIGPDPASGVEDDYKREDSDVVGNVIYAAPNVVQPEAWHLVRIGGDGTGDTGGRYRFVNNTFIFNPQTTGSAFRVFDRVESVEMHNNVFARVGGGGVNVMRTTEAIWTMGTEIATGSKNWVASGSTGIPAQWTGTLSGANPGFVDLAARKFWPATGSPLIDAGNASPVGPSGHAMPSALMPPAFHPPKATIEALGGASSRPVAGTIDIGAYEGGTTGTPPPPPPPTACVDQTVRSIVASTDDPPNIAGNVLDGNYSTRWSGYGTGATLTADLGATKSICGTSVAWHLGNARRETFAIAVSTDGVSYRTVFSGTSSGTTLSLEPVVIPPVSARYVRLIGNGNTQGLWNSVTELKVQAK